MASLEEYRALVAEMKVHRRGGRPAPHKAVLMLAVASMVEEGYVSEPFVPLSELLEYTFRVVWREHVPLCSPFACNMAYPFYHMQSSPFWRLVKAPGHTGQREYSTVAALRRDYTGAAIDGELLRLLQQPDSRDELRRQLRESYLTSPAGAGGVVPGGMALLALLSLCASVS